MLDGDTIAALRRERAKWDGRVEAEGRERPGPFMTVSSRAD